MWTRRKFIRKWFRISLSILVLHPLTICWAKTRKVLPKGFSKGELKDMNPAEIDSRNLEIDPLDQFGTMGPIDVAVDLKTYRLKVKGKVGRPLSISYDQILKLPSLTEVVLLICPGFFVNNGRWTGVSFRTLLKNANVHQGAKYLDVKGVYGKVVRISLKDI